MKDCLFCKIIRGEIPSEIIYQTDDLVVIKDINPSAPVHLLVIPIQHIGTINEMRVQDELTLGKLFSGAKKAAELSDVDQTGYRLIVNTGPDALQSVFHVHMHLLGGSKLNLSMG